MRHVHPSCIQRWILEKGAMTCEVCKEEYQGTFQPPALAPPPPSSAPPPRQISPPLSHVRHVHPRSVFISIEPEIDVGSPIRRWVT